MSVRNNTVQGVAMGQPFGKLGAKYNAAIIDFISRVVLDGGGGEAIPCVNAYYNKFVTPLVVLLLSLQFNSVENSQYLTFL